MEAQQAISLVAQWVRSRGLDYPTEDLEADRFESGWSVYAPVDVDDSDPMAFLEMPVGRSIFLIGDSGRIEEVSSSIPPQQARAEFTARELGIQRTDSGVGAKTMDPRRIELNRRHSQEMGALFAQFLDTRSDLESEGDVGEMSDAQEDAWAAFSAELLAQHQAERSALADEIEAEQRGEWPVDIQSTKSDKARKEGLN